MFCLHTIGMNIHHHENFTIHRPLGSGDWLLVIFKTNAYITLAGNEISAPPDSAILFSPGTPQYYHSDGNAYINHFLHFSCSTTDISSSISKVHYNELLFLNNLKEVEELLHLLCREQVSLSANKKAYVDLLLQMLTLKLADGYAKIATPSAGTYAGALNLLRADIYATPGNYSSVYSMAEKLQLSTSYLHQLYREQFNVSCYEDLLAARTHAACYYLQHTDFSIHEIASLCGYENDVVFMRLFKRRTGQTPTKFRELIRK